MALYDLPRAQLREYKPDVREPADFDEFWTATLAEARSAGGDAVLGDVLRLAGVEITDVTFPGFGGHPIKAWYARPAGVSRKTCLASWRSRATAAAGDSRSSTPCG